MKFFFLGFVRKKKDVPPPSGCLMSRRNANKLLVLLSLYFALGRFGYGGGCDSGSRMPKGVGAEEREKNEKTNLEAFRKFVESVLRTQVLLHIGSGEHVVRVNYTITSQNQPNTVFGLFENPMKDEFLKRETQIAYTLVQPLEEGLSVSCERAPKGLAKMTIKVPSMKFIDPVITNKSHEEQTDFIGSVYEEDKFDVQKAIEKWEQEVALWRLYADLYGKHDVETGEAHCESLAKSVAGKIAQIVSTFNGGADSNVGTIEVSIPFVVGNKPDLGDRTVEGSKDTYTIKGNFADDLSDHVLGKKTVHVLLEQSQGKRVVIRTEIKKEDDERSRSIPDSGH